MVSKARSASLWLGSLTVLAGCAGEHVTSLRTPPHPVASRAVSEVEVFVSASPARPYVDVALLEVSGLYTPGAWIAAIRELAARNGCDGVVLEQQPAAVCIVYSVPLAPPPPPPGPTKTPTEAGIAPIR